VNAPVVLERLGVKCDVVKSTDDIDYTELLSVEAVSEDGAVRGAAGTLFTKAAKPRIVSINQREVEVEAAGKLLIIENKDQPGMIGYIGTLLGRDGVNIANMSLSRQAPGQTALIVINLDSEPSDAVRRELKGNAGIALAKYVEL
jgi:D-3-phosphoglycerate dehydrogenase / 2-oxoglutarate reductase